MAQPIVSTQTANNSILDVAERQAYLGNKFNVPYVMALTGTSETSVISIANPSTATKSLFIYYRSIATNGVSDVEVRYYVGPTITAAGTVATPANFRTGSSNVSISSCHTTPTTSANGTLISLMTAGFQSVLNPSMIIIDPGVTLLITGQASAISTNLYMETTWFEI